MAAKSLKLGNFHVGHQDTLTITFLESGTFCSPDADDFNPPLPNGVFFKKRDTWPANGEATPTDKNATKQTRYTFHESPNPVACEQGTGVGDSGATTVPGGPATFNVIHIP
jgi:hypothetical protein